MNLAPISLDTQPQRTISNGASGSLSQRIHHLPSRCKHSILVHGHLQGKVPLEQLEAAAAECYSGHEAWLDSATIQSIRSEALLALHPDKNQTLAAEYCNNLFNLFQQRVYNLTKSSDAALFWESLVDESVAAVAYLSFCFGQASQRAQDCQNKREET